MTSQNIAGERLYIHWQRQDTTLACGRAHLPWADGTGRDIQCCRLTVGKVSCPECLAIHRKETITCAPTRPATDPTDASASSPSSSAAPPPSAGPGSPSANLPLARDWRDQP